jgi:hypothetical protein
MGRVASATRVPRVMVQVPATLPAQVRVVPAVLALVVATQRRCAQRRWSWSWGSQPGATAVVVAPSLAGPYCISLRPPFPLLRDVPPSG